MLRWPWPIPIFVRRRIFFPDVKKLESAGTVFSIIEQELGMKFTRGEQQVWAAAASVEEAEALEIEPGAPVSW
jgi:GntR family transcriptional regulator